MDLYLLVHRMRSVLLVLCHWGFPGHHLHFYTSWQKQLTTNRTLLTSIYARSSLLRIDPIRDLRRGLVVTDPGGSRLSLLGGVVVLVQVLDIQRATSLVQVNTTHHWTVDLNGLRSVSLLGVQFSAISARMLNQEAILLLNVMAVCCVVIIRCRHYGLSGWVEAEISLVHKLLIE